LIFRLGRSLPNYPASPPGADRHVGAVITLDPLFTQHVADL
jgi:hypothetical protein